MPVCLVPCASRKANFVTQHSAWLYYKAVTVRLQLTWRVCSHAMNYRQKENGHQHRTKEETLPRRELSGGRKGSSDWSRPCKQATAELEELLLFVPCQPPAPPTSNEELRAGAFAKRGRNEAREKGLQGPGRGERRMAMRRRLHTSAALAACGCTSSGCATSAGCCCTLLPQGWRYKQPMLEHPGDFRGDYIQ
jgi:hypothetical protein